MLKDKMALPPSEDADGVVGKQFAGNEVSEDVLQ